MFYKIFQSFSYDSVWFFQSARYYKSLKIFHILMDKFEMYLWLYFPPSSSPPSSYLLHKPDRFYVL